MVDAFAGYTNSKDHFLIIGAGPVGLAVAKALKDSAIPYVQAEADDDVGGNWYHGVYETANILSSREATEYPGFPMPAHYPDFPSARQMYEYYRLFVDEFHLRENIRFRKTVVSVLPAEDNLWAVAFNDGTKEIYKGVLICNGHHWSRNIPQFPGNFTGETFHSKDYKSPEQLRGKNVLVIGSGNSAFDISSEGARVGKKCLLSVRRGIWIFPKTFMGKPLSAFQKFNLPVWLKMRIGKLMLKLSIGDPRQYGFPKPDIGVFDRHPTINTDTLINIKNGRITVKGAVKKFEGRTVVFQDDSCEEIDLVVYATGFHVDFPFLPASLKRVQGSVVKTYAFGLYDDYKGLYTVGWFQPRGGVGSLIEPYAHLLAKWIKLQDEIKVPLGLVLRESGEELPGTHLFGGPEFLKWVKEKNRQLEKLKRMGKQFDRKHPQFSNKIITEEIQFKEKENVY